MEFKKWLEYLGCNVKVTQEDDGSGFEVLEVRSPGGDKWEVSVTK